MPLIFSRSCEYALQSAIYLAAQPEGTPVLQREISQALQIPNHFLGKILQVLTKQGILSSHKGKAGGFLLKRPAEDISLWTIIEIVEGRTFLDECVLGFPGCGDDNPCPVHFEWTAAKQAVLEMLRGKSIGELSTDIDGKLDYIQLLNERR